MRSQTGLAHIGASFLFALLTVVLAPQAHGEEATSLCITDAERVAVTDKIAEVFGHYYPDATLEKKMIARLEAETERGTYDTYDEMATFTARLTQDMRAVSRDRHITIWPYEPIPDDLAAEVLLGSPKENFGFEKVERLPGNIGYIKLTSFFNTRTAAPTAIAAMNFVGHCEALIFDLRANGGGDETMAQLLGSYLFAQQTRLVDVEVPSENRVQQIATLEWVPGPRLPDVPVYILLDRFSYSCAEYFTFALQQSGRAVVVGERTNGGAHAVKYLSFPEIGVNIRVPYTTTVKPGTHETFVDGIVPDVPSTGEKALAVAGVRILSALLQRETEPSKRYVLEWALAGYRAELEPVQLDRASLREYVGAYGDSRIDLDGSRLRLLREGRLTRGLIPLGGDDFMFENAELRRYRIRFTRDASRRVDGLLWHDIDGDSSPPYRRAR